jgi:hypothetical protein
MPQIPSDPPNTCPVCESGYESVSDHDGGLMIALNDNEKYRRVCCAPRDTGDTAQIRFYHHAIDDASHC